MKQVKKFLSNIWPTLKPLIIEQLKGAVVKTALRTFLKTGAGIGFKAWLIKFLVEELFEDFVEPLIVAAFIFMGFTYHRQEGNIIVKKIDKAVQENNAQDYNDATDDVFS